MPTFNLTPLVKPFQDAIDCLIRQMGRDILVVFQPTITEVADQFNDPIRGESIRLPNFKNETTNEPTIIENSKIIKALIEYAPKNFKDYGIKVQKPNSVIQLKTWLSNAPDLMRCEYIIPSYNVSNIIYAKYKLLREPIPGGLQEDRYCISFFERI